MSNSSSANADLVFLGMAQPSPELNYPEYYQGLQQMAEGLPPTIFVLAAPNFAFAEILQETNPPK